jgi:hypothetical protein
MTRECEPVQQGLARRTYTDEADSQCVPPQNIGNRIPVRSSTQADAESDRDMRVVLRGETWRFDIELSFPFCKSSFH